MKKALIVSAVVAAAIGSTEAANLRASEKSAIADSRKMDMFMDIYGSQITKAPGYKRNPATFLKHFIDEQKEKTQKEHDESLSEAKEQCTDDFKISVQVTPAADWHSSNLSGCDTTSVCGSRTSDFAKKGKVAHQCEQKNEILVKEHTRHLNEQQAIVKDMSTQLGKGNAERAAKHKTYSNRRGEHTEAVKIIEEVMGMISANQQVSLLEEQRVVLSKLPQLAPVMTMLETGVSRPDQIAKLMKLCNEFVKILNDARKLLDEKEKDQSEEWGLVSSDLTEKMTKAQDKADASQARITAAQSEGAECNTEHTAEMKKFNNMVDICKRQHTNFVRTATDQKTLLHLMDRVYAMVLDRVNAKVLEREPSSTGAATSAATGGEEKPVEKPTAASTGQAAPAATGASTGPAATGASTGPAATGASTGPAATGASTGPAATGASTGPAATGASTGPAATGASTGPAATGASPSPEKEEVHWTKKVFDKLLQHFDANKDGRLNYAEAKKSGYPGNEATFLRMTGGKSTANHDDFKNSVRDAMVKQFNALVRYFDKNGDKRLSAEEIRIPKQHLKGFLAHAGEDKKMSKSEFFKFMDFQMDQALKQRDAMEEERARKKQSPVEESIDTMKKMFLFF